MQTIRIRQTTLPLRVENDLILQISTTVRVADLQKLISEKLQISEVRQKLYYGGKELFSDQKITDYKINDQDVIQLMVKSAKENLETQCDKDVFTSDNIELIDAISKYYEIGDPVDVIYKEIGAWFEAKIVGIFMNQNKKNAKEEDLTFQVVMDREEQTAPMYVNFAYIRPRSTLFYERFELNPGMIVFVNYNVQRPRERGYWYDLKITKINKNTMEGTLMLGLHLENIDNCIIKFMDEVMKIEKPVLLNHKVSHIRNEAIPLRKLPLYCKKCKDVSLKDCKVCSCNICGKKIFVDKLIICDECSDTYHLFCLDPPLSEIPDEPDWYCPECKTDENEIVKAGENLKNLQSRNNENRNELQSIYFPKFFGPIFGIGVGTTWNYRSQVFESGIHGSLTGDIYGDEEGVYSIILDGEHEIYQDDGSEFYYTIACGRGGSTPNRQTISIKLSVQQSTPAIKQLALNCYNNKTINSSFGKAVVWKRGKPIRLIRSSNIGNISKFAPKTGYRYDGIYKVLEYFPVFIEATKTIVWRFLMKRDDPKSPPWNQMNEKSTLKDIEVNQENPNKKAKVDIFHLGEKIMRFINDDFVNEKTWDECKRSLQQGREHFLEKVKELFTCACCQDLVYMPVTTSCKHNICFECLKNCFTAEIYCCPSCRLELDKKILIKINRNLDSALKLIFAGYKFY